MNFFVPQTKLMFKARDGATTYKKFDHPQTPFDRVMACKDVSELEKEKLRSIKARLNPFHLHLALKRKLQNLELKLKELRVIDVKNQSAKPFAA